MMVVVVLLLFVECLCCSTTGRWHNDGLTATYDDEGRHAREIAILIIINRHHSTGATHMHRRLFGIPGPVWTPATCTGPGLSVVWTSCNLRIEHVLTFSIGSGKTSTIPNSLARMIPRARSDTLCGLVMACRVHAIVFLPRAGLCRCFLVCMWSVLCILSSLQWWSESIPTGYHEIPIHPFPAVVMPSKVSKVLKRVRERASM